MAFHSPESYFNDFKLWVPIMERFLKRKMWSKHYKKIYIVLKTVNLGLKPSFLWDIGPCVSSQLVKRFISLLKQESLISPSVSVLIIGSEVFIHNVEQLNNILSAENFFMFIKMDSVIHQGSMTDEDRALLALLLDKINNHEDISSLDCPDYLLTKIFGVMLGYPVVYCSEEVETPTCYNFVSLIQVQIFVILEGKSNEIYSFSHLPSDTLRDHVEEWFQNLNARFSGLNFKKEAARYFKLALSVNVEYIPAMKNLFNLNNEVIERWHFRMLNDTFRNECFRKAISNRIKSGCGTILDIGTGTGLLSIYARKEGAGEIYACDYSSTMIEIARQVVSSNIDFNSIKIIQKLSNDVNIPQDIPQRCSLVIAEILDAAVLGEKIIQTLIHAWENLIAFKNSKVIPHKAILYIVPIQCQKIARHSYVIGKQGILDDAINFGKTSVTSNKTGPYDTENLRLVKHTCLSQPMRILTVNFDNIAELISISNGHKNLENFTIKCDEKGTINALAVWFDLYLDEDTLLSSSPTSKAACCWDQGIFPLRNPHQVEQGSSTKVNVSFSGGVLGATLAEDSGSDKIVLEVPQSVVRFLNNESIQSILRNQILFTKKNENEPNKEVLDMCPFPTMGLLLAINFQMNITAVTEIIKELSVIVDLNNLSNYYKGIHWDELFDILPQLVSKYDFIILNYLLSTGELDERLIDGLSDIRKCIKPGGVIVPSQLNICCQLIHSEQLRQASQVINLELISDIKVAKFINEYKVPYHLDFRHEETIFTRLTSQFTIGQLNLDNLSSEENVVYERAVEICDDGLLSAILYWFEFDIFNSKFSTLAHDSHINQIAWLLEKPLQVVRSDLVSVKCIYHKSFLCFTATKC